MGSGEKSFVEYHRSSIIKGMVWFIRKITATVRGRMMKVRIFIVFSLFFMNKIIYQRADFSQITSLIKGFSFNSICYIIFDGFEYVSGCRETG